MVQKCPGLRADATLRSSDASSLRSTSGPPYTAIPGAPGPPVRFEGLTALSLPKGRCLDPGWAPPATAKSRSIGTKPGGDRCGQVRIDKEYA